MPVLVAVIAAAVAALIVVAFASWHRHGAAATGDPIEAERWLVDHLASHRRSRSIVKVLDRYVWGGAMVGIAFIAVLAASALVGWILSTVDTGGGFARFDQSAADWGSSNATEFSTDALMWITHLGGTGYLLGLMLIIGVVEVIRQPRWNWSIVGFFATVGIGVAIVNNGLKWMIMRDRPSVDHLVSSGGSSFPSGHSAAAAACWAAIALVVSRRMPVGTRRWAAAGAVFIAVLVASSRVLLGVHWLTDVIAGLIVGWTWFFLIALIFGGRIHRFGEPVERLADQEALETTEQPEPVQVASDTT